MYTVTTNPKETTMAKDMNTDLEDKIGTGYNQYCPVTGTTHKYYPAKTYEELVPTPLMSDEYPETYEKRQYAILNCQCSSVVVQRVEKLS